MERKHIECHGCADEIVGAGAIIGGWEDFFTCGIIDTAGPEQS
jgi:hypothetical protein